MGVEAVGGPMAEWAIAEAVERAMVAVTAEGGAWGGWGSEEGAVKEETGQEGREKVETCAAR